MEARGAEEIGILRIRGAPTEVRIVVDDAKGSEGKLSSSYEMLHAAVGAPNELTLTFGGRETNIEIVGWDGASEAEFKFQKTRSGLG